MRQQRLPKVHGPFHGRPLPGNRFAFAGFSVPGAEQRPKQIQDPNTIPGSRNIHVLKRENFSEVHDGSMGRTVFTYINGWFLW